MTIFDEAVALAEQLSPAEHAQLLKLLAERLQQRLGAEMPSPRVLPVAADEPAFWHIAEADTEADQRMSGGARAARASAASEETRAMIERWFPRPLAEAEAVELAMAETIAEWNLD